MGIKFWKGDENLRTVHKIRFKRYWGVVCILNFLVYRKYTLTPLRDDKNPSFCTDFKNVHLTFVKKCTQNKVLPKKLIFLTKTFLGCIFAIYIFEICINRRNFWYLIRHIWRRKICHLLEGTCILFENLKVKNARIGLKFSYHFQHFVPHIEIMKFRQNH